jgi:allantoin racemase
MRILMINPNTSESITQRLADAARAKMPTDTVLDTVTASFGVPYISTRTEATIGGMAVLEILAERHTDYDAAIIAAFGDPGLGAARELFDIPVVGLAEAGMLTACMLGGKFAIVTFATALGPWYKECVAWHGLENRCAGVHMLDGSFSSIDDVQEEKADLLVELCQSIVAKDEVDTIVFAGAPLAGLAGLVFERISVPVVDCAEAAVNQAATLVRLRPRKARNGSFRRPGAKPSLGLSPALAARIAHKAQAKAQM